MPFERPTLQQLIDRIRSDIEARLPGADAFLRRTYENVTAAAQAAVAHGLHGHLLFLSRQIIPDTAIAEFMTRWADIYGITRVDATQAQGPLDVTGVNTTVMPAGTTWNRSDGVSYTTDADATIVAGVATAALTAVAAGVDGNSDAGQTLTIATPIAGIDSTGTVGSGGIINGVDVETDDSLLARLLLRLSSPPKGGGPGDYEQEALKVAGVTRAWELPFNRGVGTVDVTFMVDNDPISAIPDAGDVAAVQAQIDAFAPVTADSLVFAPTGVTQNIVLSSLTPNTVAVQDAVTAELEDLWFRKANPIAIDILLSQINEAISIAAGEEDHVLTTPAADVANPQGSISVLGSITFPP